MLTKVRVESAQRDSPQTLPLCTLSEEGGGDRPIMDSHTIDSCMLP